MSYAACFDCPLSPSLHLHYRTHFASQACCVSTKLHQHPHGEFNDSADIPVSDPRAVGPEVYVRQKNERSPSACHDRALGTERPTLPVVQPRIINHGLVWPDERNIRYQRRVLTRCSDSLFAFCWQPAPHCLLKHPLPKPRQRERPKRSPLASHSSSRHWASI